MLWENQTEQGGGGGVLPYKSYGVLFGKFQEHL